MFWTERKLNKLFDRQLKRLQERSHYIYTRGSIEGLTNKRSQIISRALNLAPHMGNGDVPFLPVVKRSAATFSELMSTVRAPSGKKDRGITDIRETENLVLVPDGHYYYMLWVSRWKPGGPGSITDDRRPTTEEIISCGIHMDLSASDQLYAFGSLAVTCLGDKCVPGLWMDFLKDGPSLSAAYLPDYSDRRFRDGFVPSCLERI